MKFWACVAMLLLLMYGAASPAWAQQDAATRQLDQISAPQAQDDKQRASQEKKKIRADKRAMKKAMKQDKKAAAEQAKKDRKDPAKHSQPLGFRG